MIRVDEVEGVLLDLDGTLFRGQEAIPGAIAFIKTLQSRSIPFLYWTNNSTRTPDAVAEHLRELGFGATADQVYTSSQALMDLLNQHLNRGDAVYVVGEHGLQASVNEAGWRDLAHGESVQGENAKAVLVGLDRQATYQSLGGALRHILAGAAFYATNNDRVLPTDQGLAPGAGAVLAFLETASGRRAQIAGKPSPEFVVTAATRLGIRVSATLVIGDNLATDVQAGKLAGAITAWVRTGVPGDPLTLAQSVRPDYTIEQLGELLA